MPKVLPLTPKAFYTSSLLLEESYPMLTHLRLSETGDFRTGLCIGAHRPTCIRQLIL